MGVNRRQFLAAAGAVPGALLAPRRSKMQFGLTTYQWGSTWDIPTLIRNCARAKAPGVELRTSAKYAHGVEIEMGAHERREVRKRFADSPVKLVGIASSERFDWPEPAKLEGAIEAAKAHVKLSSDVGSSGVRVFPNDFHKGVPEEVTIAQIARALNELGKFAAGHGQMIRIENHGSAGRLATLRKIMQQVEAKNVRVKLNGDARDAERFAEDFAALKSRLADTLHFHELPDERFPYQLQTDLLVDHGWQGWWLLEASGNVPDRFAALVEQRKRWEELVTRSLARV